MKSFLRRLMAFALVALLAIATGVLLFRDVSPREISALPHSEEVLCLAFSPDGTYLAVGGKGPKKRFPFWDGEITVWDVRNNTKVRQTGTSLWVQSVSFSPAGEELAVGCGVLWFGRRDIPGFAEKAGELQLLEFPSLKVKAKTEEGTAVLVVRYAPDGLTVGSSSFTSVEVAGGQVPGVAKVWFSADLKLKASLEGLCHWFLAIDFGPDSKAIAIGDGCTPNQGVVRIFDTTTLKKTLDMPVEFGAVQEVHYSPDGNLLALMTSRPGPLRLWDMRTRQDVTTKDLAAVLGYSYRSAFSPNGKLLAATTNRGGLTTGESGVVIWDLQANKLRARWDWPDRSCFRRWRFHRTANSWRWAPPRER